MTSVLLPEGELRVARCDMLDKLIAVGDGDAALLYLCLLYTSTAACTHLDVDVEKYAAFLQDASTLPQAQIDGLNREDRNLKMTRPAFGGHLMATIICPRFRPQMATVRPGVLKKGEYNEAKANAVVVEPVAFELSEADIKTKVLEMCIRDSSSAVPSVDAVMENLLVSGWKNRYNKGDKP